MVLLPLYSQYCTIAGDVQVQKYQRHPRYPRYLAGVDARAIATAWCIGGCHGCILLSVHAFLALFSLHTLCSPRRTPPGHCRLFASPPLLYHLFLSLFPSIFSHEPLGRCVFIARLLVNHNHQPCPSSPHPWILTTTHGHITT